MNFQIRTRPVEGGFGWSIELHEESGGPGLPLAESEHAWPNAGAARQAAKTTLLIRLGRLFEGRQPEPQIFTEEMIAQARGEHVGTLMVDTLENLQQRLNRELSKRIGMQKRLNEMTALVHRIVQFQVSNDSGIDDLRQRILDLERTVQDQVARMKLEDEEVQRRLRQAAPPEEHVGTNGVTEYVIRGVVVASGGGQVVIVVDRETPYYPDVNETVEMHFMNKLGWDAEEEETAQRILPWPGDDLLAEHLIQSHGFTQVIPERSMRDLPGYHNRAHEDSTAKYLDHRHVGFRS